MSTKTTETDSHIQALHINGLDGRMLRLEAPKGKKREILLIYGHHSSIERMYGLALDLNRYGGVTLPDLPGYGGMDSLYKIGQKPSLDNMADYLAAFVKMHYKRRRATIAAMSFGFAVVVRMLQRNPELTQRVDLLVSIVGFAHHEDFRFNRSTYLMLRYSASLLSRRIPAFLFQNIALRGPVIRATYKLVENKHAKLMDGDAAERARRINFEIGLWKCNDIRTYMDNGVTMFTLDLCKQRIALPVWHISVEPDRYFDNHLVEQHLFVIFDEVHVVASKVVGHAPTVVATAEEAAPFIPAKIRQILARNP